jgi:hypothetical protein
MIKSLQSNRNQPLKKGEKKPKQSHNTPMLHKWSCCYEMCALSSQIQLVECLQMTCNLSAAVAAEALWSMAQPAMLFN